MRLILSSIIILVISGVLFSQTSTPASSNLCAPPEEICMGVGCEKRVPVIFGKPYLVPNLKIRLLDKYTNKPMAGAEITLNYNWEWLEYPYTEHPFGAWSQENYSTTCYANADGVIEVGEFNVEPHGWYKGIHSVGKKPRFLNVTVGYDLPYIHSPEKKCHTYTDISKAQLDKCRRTGKCEFTVKDACPLDWK